MIHKKVAGVFGTLALAGGIAAALGAPAAAHHNVPDIAHVKGDCGEVTFTAEVETPGVDNALLVVDDGTAAQTATIGGGVEVGPFGAGWHTIHYRIFGGGERDYDSPQWSVSDKNVINKFAADHGGWAFTAAGVEATAPFVAWHHVKVKGCATESTVSFDPGCDGTTVTVTSGTFLRSYEWTAGWAEGAESATLTLDAGSSGELAQVPVGGGEITVDFTGSPYGWPKVYTYDEAEAEEDCTPPTPDAPPTVPPTAGPPVTGGGGEASADQLPLTGSPIPALVVTGGLLIGGGGLAVWAARRRKGPLITLPTE